MRMFPEFFELPTWIPVRDGNLIARKIYSRHYSCRQYRDGRRPIKMMGPGYYLLYLLAPNLDGLIGWLKSARPRMDHQEGVNCTVFRNESLSLSSKLILQNEPMVWERWPGERLFTYIDGGKIRSSNPGCCFKKAGWRRCGRSKGGLDILEKLP